MIKAPFRARRVGFERLEDRSLMTIAGLPQLSSRPGASATLYLDVDGDFQSQWGGHASVSSPAYDTDGNKSSFSSAEISAIREIWARVAEDYAPFNINVTTVAPPRIADRASAKIVVGGSYSDWYGSSAGGVSYVGGFAGGSSNVGFVFANSLAGGNPRYVAEAASHEAGHLFGLEHQASWSGGQLVTEYNAGTSAWAPIMGVGYYAARTTWSNGTTSDGPAAYQDDMSRIASPTNGFGYVPDDYGSTIATAANLPVVGTTTNLSGLIGRNDDRDVFKFATAGGAVNFTLNVASYGPDLDGVIELQNATGKTLTSSNPSNSLGASLATTLAAGTYYLVVHSSGGYGNLGHYTIHGNLAAATGTTTTQPPPPTTPSADQGEGEGPVTPLPPTTSVKIGDDGDAAFSSTGAWQKLSGVGYSSDIHYAAAGSSASSTWTFSGLAPGQYRVAATWSGSQLNATDAPFAISSGGRLLGTAHVNQQRAASTFTSGGASWQNLGTFTITGNSLTVRLNSAAGGRVIADAIRLERVYSTTGGAALVKAGLVDALGTSVFTTPLTPSASQAPQQSSSAILAAAADGYFQNAAGETLAPLGSFSDEFLPPTADGGPDEFTLPAIDAVLADGSLFQGNDEPGIV